jgi:hypothetical protein
MVTALWERVRVASEPSARLAASSLVSLKPTNARTSVFRGQKTDSKEDRRESERHGAVVVKALRLRNRVKPPA